MPGINVAALSGGDLRRLLKVAHARADGLLADRLEWEIAARASSVVRPAGPFATLADDPDEAAETLAAYDVEPFEPEYVHPVSGRRSGVLLVSLGAVVGSLLSATVFWSIERLPALDRAEPHPTRAMSLRSAPPVQPPAPAPVLVVSQIAPKQAVARMAPEAFPPLPKPIAVDAPATMPPVKVGKPATAAPKAIREMAPAAMPPVEVAKQTAAPKVVKEAAPAKPVVVKAATKKPVEPRKPAAAKTQVAAEKSPPKKELAQGTAPAEKQAAVLKSGSPSRPPTLAEWLAKSEPARQQ
jgi:hypothetical protein